MDRTRVGWGLLTLGAVLSVVGAVMLLTGDDDGDSVPQVAAGDPVPTQAPVEPASPAPEATATPVPEPTSTSTAEATPAPTATPVPTREPSPTPVPDEDPAEFLAILVEGLRGDAELLVSRLNQATFDRYGREQCEAVLPTLADATAELELREVGEPETWEYTTDDVVTVIENAVPIEVSRVAAGQTLIQEVHWVLLDGRWTWFTDCGDPIG